MKRIIEVSKDNFSLPNEEKTRKRLYDNAESVIEATKIFCASVEALSEGLYDSRLDSRAGVIDSLNEYAKYLNVIKSDKHIWYNMSKDKNGYYKIWFEA